MFAERLVKEIFAFEHLPEPVDDNSHSNRIKILKTEGLIERNSQIDNILFTLRKKRNDAVHEYDDSLDDAKSMLRLAHRLAVWFMQVYGDWNFTPEEFVLPEKEPDIDYKSIIEKQEAEIAELIKKVEDKEQSFQTNTFPC